MGAWIFQVDPNSFSDGHPVWHRGEEDWWCLSRRLHVRRSDMVFIWQAIDHRGDPPRPRGIYARATILAVPPLTSEEASRIEELKDFGIGTWVNSRDRKRQESKPVCILLTYEETYADRPLSKEEIVDAGLGRNLHLIQFPDQEGCSLSEFEARAILHLLREQQRKKG